MARNREAHFHWSFIKIDLGVKKRTCVCDEQELISSVAHFKFSFTHKLKGKNILISASPRYLPLGETQLRCLKQNHHFSTKGMRKTQTTENFSIT